MDRKDATIYIEEWLKDEYALNGRDRTVLNMALEALRRERSIIENGYTGKEMRFYMDGKLFAARELAQ